MAKVLLRQAEAYKTSGCRQTGRQREATIQSVTEEAGRSIPGQRTQRTGVRNNEAGEQGKLKWTDRQSHAAADRTLGRSSTDWGATSHMQAGSASEVQATSRRNWADERVKPA